MANEHIFQNNLIVTGSVTASLGFFGDGAGLTGITSVSEWDGSRNGDASITGSLVVSGSNVILRVDGTSDLNGDVVIDQNIAVSNRGGVRNIAVGFDGLPETTVTYDRQTIAIGYQSGKSQVSGSSNVLLGYRAGNLGIKTMNNVAIGLDALKDNTGPTTGNNCDTSNIAIGTCSLNKLTLGIHNIGIGKNASLNALISTGSIAIGHVALEAATGNYNVAIGYESGKSNSTTTESVFVGNATGCCRQSLSVAVGSKVLREVDLGNANTGIGYHAGMNTCGSSTGNIYVGASVGPSIKTVQSHQLYIGSGSGETPLLRGNLSTGHLTINSIVSASIFSGSYVGDGSNLTNLPGTAFPFVGTARVTGSLIVSGSDTTVLLQGDTTVDQNIEISNRDNITDIGIGYQALPNSTCTTRCSIAIGYQAAQNATSGSSNLAIGVYALKSSVESRNNIAIGREALCSYIGSPTSYGFRHSDNVAIGNEVLKCNIEGSNNVAVGNCTLKYNTGGSNTVLGNMAAWRYSDNSGVFIGSRAGFCTESGYGNTIVGATAYNYGQGGSRNTVLGYGALLGVAWNSEITGDGNTALGYQSGENAEGNSYSNIYIGHKAGPSAALTESCQLYIGIGASSVPLIKGDFRQNCVTINNCLKVTQASGSFIGDGSGLTGISGAGFPYAGIARISGSLIVSQSAATGTAVTVQNGHTILAQVSQSLNFNDDTAAASGGVPLGGLYRSGNFIAIRLT